MFPPRAMSALVLGRNRLKVQNAGVRAVAQANQARFLVTNARQCPSVHLAQSLEPRSRRRRPKIAQSTRVRRRACGFPTGRCDTSVVTRRREKLERRGGLDQRLGKLIGMAGERTYM